MIREDTLCESPEGLTRPHSAELGEYTSRPCIIAGKRVRGRQIGQRRRQRIEADRFIQPSDCLSILADFQICDANSIEPIGENGISRTYAPGESDSFERRR